jgi:hypothetical protein
LLSRPEYTTRPWSDFVEAAFTKAILARQQHVTGVEGDRLQCAATKCRQKLAVTDSKLTKNIKKRQLLAVTDGYCLSMR